MADYTMCDSPTCPVRETCKRHEASGTRAHPLQSWFIDRRYGSQGCEAYLPVTPQKVSAA
jgi:hypothetical protein